MQAAQDINVVLGNVPDYDNRTYETIMKQQADESDEQYTARRELVEKLKKLGTMSDRTAAVAANLLINKGKLGTTYAPDVEATLSTLQV